jgi:hypothetical protein
MKKNNDTKIIPVTPERLSELAKADQENKVIIVPFNLGEIVYFIAEQDCGGYCELLNSGLCPHTDDEGMMLDDVSEDVLEECKHKNRFVDEIEIDEISAVLSTPNLPFEEGDEVEQTIIINDWLIVNENVFATEEEAKTKLREDNG